MRKLLSAILPLFALLCLANDESDAFITRIKGEIEAVRNNAAKVRLATEKQWHDHNKKMTELQSEADALSYQIDAISNEIASLQQETQLASQNAATQKHTTAQLNLLLGNKENAPLPERMQDTLAQKEARLHQLLTNPCIGIETEAIDQDGNILHGKAYQFGQLKIFSSNGKYAQFFDSANSSLPQMPGKLEAKSPALEITGRHPELLAPGKGLLEHLKQGGIMMIPILALGILCTILVLYKLLALAIKPLALDIRQLDDAATHSNAKGEKLEEELYSTAQQLLAQRHHLLFWLSVSAAAAPLLGLLGTVTGMIHTFQLITVFGVGDARLLADGISEALITTEAGLCVAIPALLCHAWLSRLLKRHSSNLETEITRLCQ